MGDHRCCSPPSASGRNSSVDRVVERRARSTRGQLRLEGGSFAMGDHFAEGYVADGERPVHDVVLNDFHIDATCVTNAAFAAFVKATGYITDAERYGFSAVFIAHVIHPHKNILGYPVETPWWASVAKAHWQKPEGPGSDIALRQNHPVVHVSWNDAVTYSAWAGKRLPSEAEWEYASRGGLVGRRFPWGDELRPTGRWMCNIWQGSFPNENTCEDGYDTTAPVKKFAANRYGLHGTVGNVWEWCDDWFAADFYSHSPTLSPTGPVTGEAKVMRGGSFLCHESYCYRYRVAARTSNTPDSSASNIGFRCANDGAPSAGT